MGKTRCSCPGKYGLPMSHEIPQYVKGTVLWNEKHGVFRRMGVKTPERVRFAPGQFAMVSGWQGNDPLLPRPLAIFRSDTHQSSGIVEFVYKVVGRGTALLSGLHQGDLLSIMLPLGNGFNLDAAGKSWWLAGGGVGFSTLFPVAFALAEAGADFHIFLGARNSGQHPPTEWIQAWDVSGKVTLCTDDGTLGYRGTVVSAVRERISLLTQSDKKRVTILSCGPHGMLKSLAEMALSEGIPTKVSLENHMACGFGVCWGCAAEIGTGEDKEYLRVCKEGPVFNAGDVVW